VCNTVHSVRDSVWVANDGVLNVARRQLEVHILYYLHLHRQKV